MQRVSVESRPLADYDSIVGTDTTHRLRDLAEPLRDRRIVHVNATPIGGGVAEILKSEIPLLIDLGIDAEWWTIDAPEEFFHTTKKVHNALQGADDAPADSEWKVYDEVQRQNASELDWENVDIAVIHDPQPMGIPAHVSGNSPHWIWRSHIDSSSPNEEVWSHLSRYLDPYERAIFTISGFVPPDTPSDLCVIIPPANDPLNVKNRSVPYHEAFKRLRAIGLDPARPLVSQVARLDIWKDPWGVIDAYRIVKSEIPDVQLALLGVIEAKDDPEAFDVHQRLRAYAGDDEDIHIFVDPKVVGQPEVGAVQTFAHVIFQKSIREGFGLTVSEALWKASPVIGGRAGGIPLQIEDGESGFLVRDAHQAAERTLQLLENPPVARVLAAYGRERVRENFLMTRLIADEIGVYRQALDGRDSAPTPSLEQVLAE
ncbi:MAG: glycosyltransferase [Chloroflexota bacterium]